MSATMKIDIPHVVARTNKSGKVRYYFRKRNQPMQRLPDDLNSVEFIEAYNRLKSRATGQSRDNTLGWLCDDYLNSAAFQRLSEATRKARTRIIANILKERIDPAYPERYSMEGAAQITEKHIVILRDRKSNTPNAANEWIKVLSQVFLHGIEKGYVTRNPARDVKRLNATSEGHQTATTAQIEQYLDCHTNGPAWLAMQMLTTFGMRVSDLRVLGKGNIQNKQLVFITVKTGVLCELDIPHNLAPFLSEMVFIQTENGASFKSDKAMSQRISKWFKQAGIQNVTAHSVRKWLATTMAENGATEFELMSWFGWRDPKEARPYIQKANRKKMAKSAGGKRPDREYSEQVINLDVERFLGKSVKRVERKQ